jgi:hypothetical protein
MSFPSAPCKDDPSHPSNIARPPAYLERARAGGIEEFASAAKDKSAQIPSPVFALDCDGGQSCIVESADEL